LAQVLQVLGVDYIYHRITLAEEHISIVAEPGSSNFSHTTQKSESNKYITESLVASWEELNSKTENIKVAGCVYKHGTHSGPYPVTGRNLCASSAVAGLSVL